MSISPVGWQGATEWFCWMYALETTFLLPKKSPCVETACLAFAGDYSHHYTNFANIIVSFGGLGIPIIGWLLDKKGYGITLGTINLMGVIASAFQAIPSLRFQVGHGSCCQNWRKQLTANGISVL